MSNLQRPEVVELTIDDMHAGGRLDSFLATCLSDYSRTVIKGWIESGFVRVNGSATKAKRRVWTSDVVVVEIPPSPSIELRPEKIDLNIVYEDESLVVVDKCADLIVHPGAGNPTGTVVQGLLYAVSQLSPVGLPDRPGVVHRIDKGTSGLLVFAKTEMAHHALAKQFAEHSVERMYRALIWDRGIDAEGMMDTHYGRAPHDRRKFTTKQRASKRAITHWRVAARLGPCSFVELRLETGRTHQIRVHMSEAGFPLVGDPMYGVKRRVDTDLKLRRLGHELGLGRQALHAAVLGFKHPQTGEVMRFDSQLPEDMATVLEALGYV